VGALTLVSGPTAEPITLAEARKQCRIDHAIDDGVLAGLILDAREWAQGYTRRNFIAQTWDYSLNTFPLVIELPIGPVTSITSISYYDTNNALQTFANYDANLKVAVPLICPADGYEWPDTYSRYNAVTVRFVTGYAENHPDLFTIRAAMLLHVEAHYDREKDNMASLLSTAEKKLDTLRVVNF
jgi:uncharacterized phiE125 gp8 family phage protein